MDVAYTIEIDGKETTTEIEVSVEDGCIYLSLEDTINDVLLITELNDNQINNLVKAIFAAKAYKKALDGVKSTSEANQNIHKDKDGRWILEVGDAVLLSNGYNGVVVMVDDTTCPYKVLWFDGSEQELWLYGTEKDSVVGFRIYIVDVLKPASTK